MKKKAKFWRKYRLQKTFASKTNYARIAKSCRNQINMLNLAREKTILSSGDIGAFFKYVNSKLCCKSGIGPLLNDKCEFVFDDVSRANLLNDYFAKVCVKDNLVLPEYNQKTPDVTLTTVVHIEAEVHKVLRKHKEKMSAGPDNLPPIFYKKMANCICRPLTKMFNLISASGKIPSIWKQAIVTPIFKKGKSSLPENY